MIGRRCAACFSFDEGMPRAHVSFRIRAKKAFFTSLFLFVGRGTRTNALGSFGAAFFVRTRGMLGLFACRVWNETE
jgi:hypothetical protein